MYGGIGVVGNKRFFFNAEICGMPRLTMLVELFYYSFVFGVGISSIKTNGDDGNISFIIFVPQNFGCYVVSYVSSCVLIF